MKGESEYPDLDALVLAEIESMGRVLTKRTNAAKGTGAPRPEHKPVVVGSLQRPKAAPLARIHAEDRVEEGISGEEADALFEVPLEAATGNHEEAFTQSADSLFSPEEQAFMSRAVGFLSGRENADMILGQIWERLTSDSPEAFYTADDAFETMPLRSKPQSDADQPSDAEAGQDDLDPGED